MTAAEWAVLVAGLAGIGLINWYFFVASRRAERAEHVARARRPRAERSDS